MKWIDGAVAAVGLVVGSAVWACSEPASAPEVGERVATERQALGADAGDASAADGSAGTGGGVTTVDLALQVSKNSCVANLAQDYFQVTNASGAPVPLSNLTIKYWVYDTTGTNVASEVWYGGCVTSVNGTCVHPVTGVTATATPFSPGCGPDVNHVANWEIAVSTTDPTILAAGQTWSNVQTAVNLSNYANFAPGSGTWFSGCKTGQPFANDPSFALYDQGNLVEPASGPAGATVPLCRAPQLVQIQSYIDTNFHADSDIVSSFLSAQGQNVDCIPFESQHSLKGWLARGVTVPSPPPPPVASSALAPDNPGINGGFNGAPDVNGNPQACPPGTVPALRPTVATVAAAGGVAAYAQRLASLPRLQNPQCQTPTQTNCQSPAENDCWISNVAGNGGGFGLVVDNSLVTIDFDHAVGTQTGGFLSPGGGTAAGYFGAQTTTSIYAPSFLSSSGDHADTQFWVQTGNCENWYNGSNGEPLGQQCPTAGACTASSCAVQSLEVASITTAAGLTSTAPPVSGQINNPVTQLAVFITPDGYMNNCFAGIPSLCTQCPSEMITPPPPPMSNVQIGPQPIGTDCWVAWPQAGHVVNEPRTPSGYGTPPTDLSFKVFNGSQLSPPSPGWWVYVSGGLIGWYPAETFDWPGTTTPGPMAAGPATYFQVGGEVENPWPGNTHTGTSMVSDNSALSGFEFAAYSRGVQYFDEADNAHDVTPTFSVAPALEGDDGIHGVCGFQAGSWTDDTSAAGGYTLTNLLQPGAQGWGTYLYFGGGRFATGVNCTGPNAATQMSLNSSFDVDTGFTSVGAGYGQTACPKQYLVGVDLTGSLNGAIAVAAQWSDAVTNCTGLNATMTVFALPAGVNTAWQVWDQVTYQNSGTSCAASTITHTNSVDNGFEGAVIPASSGFSQVRVAVNATQTTGATTAQIPVLIVGGP